ncbi:hypothetical protein J5X84_27710 [Streptosporangiaceae bacterium NEAU-GS5]|nr:hypothetical protein [Streptosporangiaceae bacterium NEAU-GS5]
MKKHTAAIFGSIAAAAATVAVTPPAPASATVVNGHIIDVIQGYTAVVRESNSTFNCPANEVMYTRWHSGDENGNTTYICARVFIDNERVLVSTATYAVTVKESKSWYVTPAFPDQAIVGRWHQGDENGNTTYISARMTWRGQEVRLIDRYWTGFGPERYLLGRRPTDHEIMTGREHRGDENGQTATQYATISL